MLGKFNDFGIFLIFLDYELSYSLSHSLYNLASGVHEMLRSLNLPFLHNQSLFYTQSTFFGSGVGAPKSSIYINSSLSYRLFEIGSLNVTLLWSRGTLAQHGTKHVFVVIWLKYDQLNI